MIEAISEGIDLLEISGFSVIPCKGDDEFVPLEDADVIMLIFPGAGHVGLSLDQFTKVCESAVFDWGERLKWWRTET